MKIVYMLGQNYNSENWIHTRSECLSSVKIYKKYYLFPIYSKEIINKWINYLKEEISSNLFFKEYVKLECIEEKNITYELKNVIEVDNSSLEGIKTKDSGNTYALFVNQMLRYLLDESLEKYVTKTIEIKDKYPELPFWHVFHFVHNISYTKDCYFSNYYMPFYSRDSKINSIEYIKSLLNKKASQNMSISIISASTNNGRDRHMSSDLHNLELSYNNSTYFIEDFTAFYNNPKTQLKIVTCINSVGVYLEQERQYQILGENKTNYKVRNTLSEERWYNKNRFK